MAIELAYGESFIVTFRFSYKGSARAIGLKVILGRIYVATFDEVEAWILQSNVPDCASFTSLTREARCTIPSEAATRLKSGEDYDASAEIGDYPWSGHVYIRKQDPDVVRITPLVGFKDLTVSYRKA